MITVAGGRRGSPSASTAPGGPLGGCPWTCGALVAVAVAVFLLGPGGDDLTHELAWRVPLQLGLVGLVSLVVGRAAGRTTTIDETGVRCSSRVRTDAVRWEELADVRVRGGGAVLRAVDGRTVRVAPLPRDVAEALRTAVRGGGTA